MSVWDVVVGQPRAVAALKAAVAEPETLAHAWLVLGPPGSGRTTAARAFAAALQCDQDGCGECVTCHQVLAGTHDDVRFTTTEKLSLGVDAVRDLVGWVALAPVRDDWRISVIEDADRLTDPASNSLLKSIEEPGPRRVWILCAPSDDVDPYLQRGVLPTIRSRCRVLRLGAPDPVAVTDLLVAEGADPSVAAWAARAAQGHIGRARALVNDEQARLLRITALEIARRVGTVAGCLGAASDLVAAASERAEAESKVRDAEETSALKDLLGVGVRGVSPRSGAAAIKRLADDQKLRATRLKRDPLDLALVDLAALYRDVLTIQLGAGVPLVHADREIDLQVLARGSRPEETVRRVEAVLAARDSLAANVAPLLALESMCLALRAG